MRRVNLLKEVRRKRETLIAAYAFFDYVNTHTEIINILRNTENNAHTYVCRFIHDYVR